MPRCLRRLGLVVFCSFDLCCLRNEAYSGDVAVPISAPGNVPGYTLPPRLRGTLNKTVRRRRKERSCCVTVGEGRRNSFGKPWARRGPEPLERGRGCEHRREGLRTNTNGRRKSTRIGTSTAQPRGRKEATVAVHFETEDGWKDFSEGRVLPFSGARHG